MDRPEIMAERKRNGFVSVADVLRAEGEAIGRAEGEAKGRAEGEAIGREQERAKAEEEKLASAREMLIDGDSIEKVKRILKLSEEQVALL